jgi:hypothetical protein
MNEPAEGTLEWKQFDERTNEFLRDKIHGGKLEEFKRIAVQCMESVRASDSGTLQLVKALEGFDVRVYSPYQSI